MRLFYTPGACSLAPHIVLREADLNIDIEKVQLNPPPRMTAKGEDYYTLNPKGAVPALEISPGEVLTENQVIMQYMAAQNPGAKLLPESGDRALPRAGSDEFRRHRTAQELLADLQSEADARMARRHRRQHHQEDRPVRNDPRRQAIYRGRFFPLPTRTPSQSCAGRIASTSRCRRRSLLTVPVLANGRR